jgi:1-acyl-sn-glycerol-3-phosphate acyltransferase
MNLLRGILALSLMVLNTVVLCAPLFLVGLARFLVPRAYWPPVNRWIDAIVDAWVGVNRLLFRALRVTRLVIDVVPESDLDRRHWYMVVSNHQSWSDIVVLQIALWRRIPMLKFFTKRQLLWVPFIGLAMWFLGFPYVRRLDRAQIAANPELATIDRDATLRACARFSQYPTTILNFLEGTRFTPAKHQAQSARFRHLLNPKLGGMSYVVAGMKDRIHRVLDVTITYPGRAPTFWELLQGRCPEVRILVESHPIPADVLAAPDSDATRALLAPWIESLWRRKDERVGAAMLRAS